MVYQGVVKSLFVVVLCSTVSCGRFGPPVPPEALSPKAVAELVVEPQLASIVFRWKAPSQDQRGHDLKSIDGYKVYRKVLEKPSDILDPDVKYLLLGELKDSHMIELERLRQEAREHGNLVRSVRLPPELSQFTFEDPSVVPGSDYAYRIVPFNKGDVEGQVRSIIRVNFRGLRSNLSLITMEDATSYSEMDSEE